MIGMSDAHDLLELERELHQMMFQYSKGLFRYKEEAEEFIIVNFAVMFVRVRVRVIAMKRKERNVGFFYPIGQGLRTT